MSQIKLTEPFSLQLQSDNIEFLQNTYRERKKKSVNITVIFATWKVVMEVHALVAFEACNATFASTLTGDGITTVILTPVQIASTI